MGQVIPVNWFTRATDIGGGCDPHPSFERDFLLSLSGRVVFLSVECIPAGAFNHLLEAFAQSATGDAQTIDGTGVRLDQIVQAQSNRVDAEIMRDFIEMHLDRVAWLCRAVTTFGTTGWFIGKETHALELIAGQLIRHSLQDAGIIGRGHTIGAIRATTEKRAKVHGRQSPIAFDTSLDPHFDGMTSAVDQEDLFTRAGNLDGSASATGQLAGTDFM